MPVKHAAKATVDFLGLSGAVSSLRDHAKYIFDGRVKNRNLRFKHVPAADGLPMPPPDLVYLVTGQFDSEAYYNNGVLGAARLWMRLRPYHAPMAGSDRIKAVWRGFQPAISGVVSPKFDVRPV